MENDNQIIESGIKWFHDGVLERHLRHQLYTLTKNARRTYTNDSETREYLQSVVCRLIINFVNYQGPNFQRLKNFFPNLNAVCVQHKIDNREGCIVYRASLLKSRCTLFYKATSK